jgi:hypothetical protein
MFSIIAVRFSMRQKSGLPRISASIDAINDAFVKAPKKPNFSLVNY